LDFLSAWAEGWKQGLEAEPPNRFLGSCVEIMFLTLWCGRLACNWLKMIKRFAAEDGCTTIPRQAPRTALAQPHKPSSHPRLDTSDHQLNSAGVFPTFRKNNLGQLLSGFYELQVHGTDGIQVLLHNGLYSSAPVANVSPQPSDKTNIGSCVHVDL